MFTSVPDVAIAAAAEHRRELLADAAQYRLARLARRARRRTARTTEARTTEARFTEPRTTESLSRSA